MSPDHIPSYAARKLALERQLDRRLTDEEAAQLHKQSTCLMVSTCVHRDVSQTYGGRNKPERVGGDADDLRAAQERNLEAYRDRLRADGHSDSEIDGAFQRVREANRQHGIE